MLIDRVFSTTKSILNSSGRGNFTPSNFNLTAFKAINDLYEDNLSEVNQMVNRANRGLVNGGLENLSDRIREKIQHYLTITPLAYSGGVQSFLLPEDYRYFDTVLYNDTVEAEQCKNSKEFNIIRNSGLVNPNGEYPVYLKYNATRIKILPTTIIDDVSIYYLRQPVFPRWTYNVIGGAEIFNPSASDFQDLDIHPSEESKLITRILFYFGIELKENDLVSIMQNQEAIDTNETNAS